MGSRSKSNTLRLNTYNIIRSAVEAGSRAGWWSWWRQVGKYDKSPQPIPEWLDDWLHDERCDGAVDQATETIADRVMEALDEVVRWDDGE